MRKLALCWLICLLAPSAANAEEILPKLGLQQSTAEETLLDSLLEPEGWSAPITSAMRALPPKERAAAVKALGAAARAYLESETFATRYAEERAERMPVPPQPVRSAEQLAAEQKAQIDEAVQSAESSMGALPKEQQDEIRSSLAQLKSNTPDSAVLVEADRARFHDEQLAYEEALTKAPPKDPRQAIKHRLERFLAATADVDFSAKLVKDGKLRRFVRADFEKKPYEWKLCFRAGREATEAARAFAREWLDSLK